MAFRLELAPAVFLGAGAVLVAAAGVLLAQAPRYAIYPLALGGTFILAGAAMAYDRPPKA